MTSPARASRQRAEARIAHAAERDRLAPLADAKPYELMLSKLDADMRRLKQIQSIEKKIDLKRQLLPEYAAWADGALEADSGGQDDILTNIMVWRLDTEDFPGALRIAEYVLKHGLKLPARYNRSAACLVVEEIADAAKRALDEGRAAAGSALYENALCAVELLARGRDMPDEVWAKYWKARGLMQEELKMPEFALESLRRALALNPAAGVKKDIERVARALSRAPSNTPAAPAG